MKIEMEESLASIAEFVAATSSSAVADEAKNEGIFRSMNINGTSKTPYSDATQVGTP